jgi:hypothetical protein
MTMVHEKNLPMTATQLAGHGITSVVGGLTPAMLGVLLLNVVGIGAAIYFLNLLISGQQTHLRSLLALQETSVSRVLTTHDREFDALMKIITDDMARRADQVESFPVPLQRP